MRAGLAALVMTGAVAAAPAVAPSAALARLETGQYELTVVGSTAPAKQVCIADTAMLVQLQHPGATCARTVMNDSAESTTFNYACASGGHGRTVVTITTPRSFDLSTVGIAGGAPFDVDYQGRRIGACEPRATASR